MKHISTIRYDKKKVNSRLSDEILMGYKRKTITYTSRYFSNFILNKRKKRPERK
jgi:hypothetical protein